MTGQYIPTAVHMVSQVKSIIEGYGMGPLRALAQEPVQNSKDEKNGPKVRVEYRLHRKTTNEGREYHLLTVTDSSTGGLKGPVFTQGQLDDKGHKLHEGENWAAFEGQGFTEKSGGDLGVRGQGKSAFLYHSDPSSFLQDGKERALMLYDTLLENGEYRMGVRYAKPNDTILSPPLYGDDAKLAILVEHQIEDGLTVSLGLEALTETGARIIVPFLKPNAVEAIRSGELQRWLQRCWWRAIQIQDVEIIITDEDGISETIGVPSWWSGEPWTKGDPRTREYRDILVADGLRIKRVVLHYDPNLQADEIRGCGNQYQGVQLLRGQQWIETLEVGDEVPPEHRGEFRGFAEFDKSLELALKESERPQHESFDGRNKYVSETKQKIRDLVRAFAEEQGWSSVPQTRYASRRDQEQAADFLTTFTRLKKHDNNAGIENGNRDDRDQSYSWECRLSVDLPDPLTARVDWGEKISDVTATVEVEPIPESRWSKLNLEFASEDEGNRTLIQTIELEVREGVLAHNFGDFQIVRGQSHQGQIRCPEPGVYRLRATLIHLGKRVCSDTRRIYVGMEPPPPPEGRPYAISISAKNISEPAGRRVNSGDEMLVKVTAKNRTPDKVTLELDTSFGDLLLSDGAVIEIPGTPTGETPMIVSASEEHIFLYTQAPLIPPGKVLELEPGKHFIRADLRLAGNEETVAHASHLVYFEVDPGGADPDLPFELEAVEEEGSHPMWELHQQQDDRWMLKYHALNPIYRELPESSRNGNRLSGRRSFITEICAAGLLDWALYPMKTGDTSKIDLLKGSASDENGDFLRDSYKDKLERLETEYTRSRVEEPSQYDDDQPGCASSSAESGEE